MAKLTKAATKLLGEITTATADGGFVYTTAAQRKALVEAGYVEVNESMVDETGKKLATRATEKGFEAVEGVDSETEGETTTENTGATVAGSGFAIAANVEMPKHTRGGNSNSIYPFDKLDVGQSFFVPATEAKPNPAKSLASTVTSANNRYSEVIEGETRINRKGREVPATKQLREFAVRAVEDGEPWGFAGQKGAGVWRTL